MNSAMILKHDVIQLFLCITDFNGWYVWNDLLVFTSYVSDISKQS